MTSSLSLRVLAVVLAGVTACASGRSGGVPATKPTATADDIERNRGEPIEKVLQSKAPGLLVTRTANGGIAVQIRGVSSVYGSNEPLYVIDDVPLAPGPGGALNGVNPYDIESITVLKDPADIGVYGMRGANGVIVIKMKKPGKPRD